MVNIFGLGYIGKAYAQKYDCVIQDRNNLVPNIDKCNNILFTISTIDNYNVNINPYLDIETNLILLIRVLENFRHVKNYQDKTFNFLSSWFVYGDTTLPASELSYSLTYLINELKHNRAVYLYEKGEFYRDYIDIEDACSAIHLAITKSNVNEIYNIGNGVPIKFIDIMKYVAHKLNRESLIKETPQPEFHKNVQVKSMYMDTSKLKSLGYSNKFTIHDTLDKLIVDFIK